MSRKTPTKRSFRELIAAVREKHIVTIEYLGEEYDFPWMELQDDEMPPMLIPPEGSTREEINEISLKGMEDVVFSMLQKGAKKDGDVLERSTWDELPKRMRNDIMLKVFNFRTELQNDFLQPQRKT